MEFLKGIVALIALVIMVYIIYRKIKKTVTKVKNFVTGSRGEGHSIGWQKITKNLKYDLFGNRGYTVFRGTYGRYNNVASKINEEEYELRSYYNADEFYFFTKYITNESWIRLDTSALEVLRNAISKYLEWEKKATDEGVKIQKDMPDATFVTDVAWSNGHSGKQALGSDLLVKFTFFSQSEKRHQMGLETNKIEVEALNSSGTGTAFDYESFQTQLYFDKEQVLELQKGISEEHLSSEKPNIQAELEKLEKSENAVDSFK